MKKISVLIKPASSGCNLRCKYCFYRDVSSMRQVTRHPNMDEETMRRMIDQIYVDLDEGDVISFAFQGGEPTLVGLAYFEEFVKYVESQRKRVNTEFSIQTNGTLINEEWCAFLKEKNFLVGLSIDGGKEFHNANRIDGLGKGTYQRVRRTKELLDKYQIEYNVLCVLTRQLARHPQKFYNYLKKEAIDYVQIIPCLDDFIIDNSVYILKPEQFASFYKQLFAIWLRDFQAGHYISIKLFDDIINLVNNQTIGFCGMLGQCVNQYVIEANGDVYPCDFYCLDEFKTGNILNKTLFELRRSRALDDFMCFNRETPKYCKDCPFKKMCNGGCKRLQDAMYVDEKNNYCGYQDLLKTVLPKMQLINQTMMLH